jgi:DNA mismatch repair protein MSH3
MLASVGCSSSAVRKLLKRPSLKWVTVSDVEVKSRWWCGLILITWFQYLIEVANAEKTKMPANWNRVQSTKRVTRFHTPEARKAISERERYKETLDAG